jgi:hypothetical protein
MTPLAKKVFDLFGKPELAAEEPAATVRLSPEPAPFNDDERETALTADAWLCPHCGQPATIEDVGPSLDGERTLTFWSCEPCDLAAVTPDAIRLPPSSWVKRTEQ